MVGIVHAITQSEIEKGNAMNTYFQDSNKKRLVGTTGLRFVQFFITFGGMVCAILGTVPAARAVPGIDGNPFGETVVAGEASFDRATAGILTVTTSDRAIINWQSFSIAAGNTTEFIQPGASSAVLNRVVGGDMSSLLGTLRANGQVYLINPNGIVVGAGAVIDTAGFVASTLDVNNEEFMAGGDMNFVGNSEAEIVNLGRITALHGDVVLLARHIQNDGVIEAPDGTVALGAGREVLLVQAGADERILVRPDTGGQTPSGTGIKQNGVIESVRAELEASGNIYALAINHGGITRATGAQTRNGRVLLTAAGGTIDNRGTVAARKTDGTGGQIAAAARTVINTGHLQANGTQGGEVTVQADYVDNSGTLEAQGGVGAGGTVTVAGAVRVLQTASGTVQAGSDGAAGGTTTQIGRAHV